MKYRIAILALNHDFEREPRVSIEVEALANIFDLAGYGKSTSKKKRSKIKTFNTERGKKSINRVEKLKHNIYKIISYKLYISSVLKKYRYIKDHIIKEKYNLVIAHHIIEAFICIEANQRFVFHSEEYLPRQFDGNLRFRLIEMGFRDWAFCKIKLRASAIIVESDAVRNEYHTVYGFKKECIYVLPNLPRYRINIPNNKVYDKGTIHLIHHGKLVPERGLEKLIKIADKLGNSYHLTLMGDGPKWYINKLNRMSIKINNTAIKNAVPYNTLVEEVSKYDLGLIFFDSEHFHHNYMTVPNKFWDCIQARVPVIVDSKSAMSPIVNKYKCGITFHDSDENVIVETIKSISSENLQRMKKRCDSISLKYSRESFSINFIHFIKELIMEGEKNEK